MADRVIFHCDLNCFFASVELLDKPALREVPVAVCGDPASRHGIILAKNEPAKRSGRPDGGDRVAGQAEVSEPDPAAAPPRTVRASTPAVSTPSTGSIPTWWSPSASTRAGWTSPAACTCSAVTPDSWRTTSAPRLRQELGLTISVGVSFNKVFAKLGSDYKKPDATTVISRENWRDIVWPLPVGDLLFVGRAAQRTLGQYGVETIGQLAACKPEMLEQLMGKMGVQLYRYANGLDDAPVRPQHQREPVKSVGNSSTFPENLTRWEEIRSGLQLLSDSVAGRLRKEGLYCGGVAVAVKDAQFRTVSRQMRLGAPTHLMRDIFEAAQELTRRIWKTPTPVRLLSVTALYITDSADSYQQLDLLAGDAPLRDQRQEQLESAMDTIRGKYGRDAIAFGRGGKVGWNKDE